MESQQSPVKPGDELAGKYRVEEVLGVGGMGVVVSAMHVQLEERVAIKFLLPEAMKVTGTVERFSREARAAVKIKSEHVVRVTDVGSLDGGAPYMVMEHLTGQDLAKILEGGPLPPEDAIDFIIQALEAVAEAHALGIVHRDLKPANLFLTQRRDGSTCIKVLDFGISKTAGGAAALTQTANVVGSPHYMSPEQWMSAKDIDGRSDIWSIGTILFQLLAGRPPFEGDSVATLCASVMQGQAIPLRAIRPDLPEALGQVIARCLQRDVQQRFANVGDLAAALQPFAPARSLVSIQRVQGTVAGANGTGPRKPLVSDPGIGFSNATAYLPHTPHPGPMPTPHPAHVSPIPGAQPTPQPQFQSAPPPAYGPPPQPHYGAPPQPYQAQFHADSTTGAPLTGTIARPGAKKSSAIYIVLGILLVIVGGIGAGGLWFYFKVKAAAEELAKAPPAGLVAPPSTAAAAAGAGADEPPPAASASGAAEAPAAPANAPVAAAQKRSTGAANVTGGGAAPKASAKATASASATGLGPPPPAPPPPPGQAASAAPAATTKKSDLGGRL